MKDDPPEERGLSPALALLLVPSRRVVSCPSSFSSLSMPMSLSLEVLFKSAGLVLRVVRAGDTVPERVGRSSSMRSIFASDKLPFTVSPAPLLLLSFPSSSEHPNSWVDAGGPCTWMGLEQTIAG